MLGYFFVLFADDEELYGLACAVHHLVQYEAANVEGDITVYHFFPVLQHKVAGRNNDKVANQHHPSQRDVSVFIDDSGYNIRTARTSVRGESDADAAATERRADDACHERLVVQQLDAGCQLLNDGQKESQGKDGKDCLDAELPPQNADGEQ